MNKFKQFFGAIVLIILGIVYLNHSLFSLPENACYCYDMDMAEMSCADECEERCGCAGVMRQGGWCEERTCISLFTIYCESGYYCTSYQYAYSCFDCGEL